MMRRTPLTLPFVLLLVSISHAQVESQVARNTDFLVPPETFPIFPWDTLPATRPAYDEARACGFNLAGFAHPENLDLIHAAGLKCFVTDPSIKVRGGEKFSDDQIASAAKALADRTANHPAVFGYHVVDEPSPQLVPTAARWTRALDAAAPRSIAYVNLFPIGGKEKEADYESYLTSYVDLSHAKAFSFDHYSLLDDGSLRPTYFQCLEVARRVSLAKNVPFWQIILANSHFRYADPSLITFRFQIFTSLAYGARGIGYFTYTGRDRGNYRNAAIDLFGHRSPTWDMIRDTNLQLHRLAPIITKLKSVNVFHHPAVPQGGKGLPESKFLSDIKGTGPFCVGEFQDDQGRPAVLVVNRDLLHSTQLTIVPKTKTPIQRVSSYTGQTRPWSAEDNWLPPGGGILLLLHD